MRFLDRVRSLPSLGVGVSTEYGAGDRGLDPLALRRRHPGYARFLEVGVEVDKGLDRQALAWVAGGAPTTYHFLDVNLDEPEDLDPAWLAATRALADALDPAWICGDAGLWHFGPRERGHMLLLPPILSEDAAAGMAEGVIALREALGREVLPENPPGQVFLGDLHLLEFFARLCEAADTGLLLDCAHLAIFQRLRGHAPTDGLADFPLERVVELHRAGGEAREREGFTWVEDHHGVEVLPDTWAIFEAVISAAPNLKAVVFECERNSIEQTLPGFARICAALKAAGRGDLLAPPGGPQ